MLDSLKWKSQLGLVGTALMLGLAVVAIATTIVGAQVASNRDISLSNQSEAAEGDFWCGGCGGFWGYYSSGKNCNQLALERCGTQPCYVTGTCDTGCSPAGSSRCSGVYIQVCQSNGTWQTTNQSCGQNPAPPPAPAACGTHGHGTQWYENFCTYACNDGKVSTVGCNPFPIGTSCSADYQCQTGYCNTTSGKTPVCAIPATPAPAACGKNAHGSTWTENNCTYSCTNGTTTQVSCATPKPTPDNTPRSCDKYVHNQTWTENECTYLCTNGTISQVACATPKPTPDNTPKSCDKYAHNQTWVERDCIYLCTNGTISQVSCATPKPTPDNTPKSCDKYVHNQTWTENECTYLCTNGTISQVACATPKPTAAPLACGKYAHNETWSEDNCTFLCVNGNTSTLSCREPETTESPKPGTNPEDPDEPLSCGTQAHDSTWIDENCTYSCDDGRVTQEFCELLDLYQSCTQSAQCQSGKCEYDPVRQSSICKATLEEPEDEGAKANGAFCLNNSQCQSGRCSLFVCRAQPTPTPTPPQQPIPESNNLGTNEACSTNTQCKSGRCEYDSARQANVCKDSTTAPKETSTPTPTATPITNLQTNTQCSSNSQCQSGKCEYDPVRQYAICKSNEPVDPNAPKTNNSFCLNNSQCQSNYCSLFVCRNRPNPTATPTPSPTATPNTDNCQVGGFYTYTPRSNCCYGDEYRSNGRRYCKDEAEPVASSQVCCLNGSDVSGLTGYECSRRGGRAGACTNPQTSNLSNNQTCQSDGQCQSGVCYQLTSSYSYCAACVSSPNSRYSCNSGSTCVSGQCVANTSSSNFTCPTDTTASGDRLVASCTCSQGNVSPGQACRGDLVSINLANGDSVSSDRAYTDYAFGVLDPNPTFNATSNRCPDAAYTCTCAPREENIDGTAPTEVVTGGETCGAGRIISQANMGDGNLVTNPEYELTDPFSVGDRANNYLGPIYDTRAWVWGTDAANQQFEDVVNGTAGATNIPIWLPSITIEGFEVFGGIDTNLRIHTLDSLGSNCYNRSQADCNSAAAAFFAPLGIGAAPAIFTTPVQAALLPLGIYETGNQANQARECIWGGNTLRNCFTDIRDTVGNAALTSLDIYALNRGLRGATLADDTVSAANRGENVVEVVGRGDEVVEVVQDGNRAINEGSYFDNIPCPIPAVRGVIDDTESSANTFSRDSADGQVLGCSDRYGLTGNLGSQFDDIARRTTPSGLDPELFAPPSSIESNTLASARDLIDFTDLSHEEIRALAASSNTTMAQRLFRASESIQNYDSALTYVVNLGQTNSPLNVDELVHINEILAGGRSSGLREVDVLATITDDLIDWNYIPHQDVPSATQEIFSFADNALNNGIPNDQLAAAMRELVVRVHPFPNGNGRTASLVESYYLNLNP